MLDDASAAQLDMRDAQPRCERPRIDHVRTEDLQDLAQARQGLEAWLLATGAVRWRQSRSDGMHTDLMHRTGRFTPLTVGRGNGRDAAVSANGWTRSLAITVDSPPAAQAMAALDAERCSASLTAFAAAARCRWAGVIGRGVR